ncbi:MAG: hypothetical protein H6745_32665 [Deltaproteobacteria bacterium]|nr:hypothetical protein [Deltaproteobacteria bacterium]
METTPFRFTPGRVAALVLAVGAVSAYVVWQQTRSSPPAAPPSPAPVAVPSEPAPAAPGAAVASAPEAPGPALAPPLPGDPGTGSDTTLLPPEELEEIYFSTSKSAMAPPLSPPRKAAGISPEPKRQVGAVSPPAPGQAVPDRRLQLVPVAPGQPSHQVPEPSPDDRRVYFSTSKAMMAPDLRPPSDADATDGGDADAR